MCMCRDGAEHACVLHAGGTHLPCWRPSAPHQAAMLPPSAHWMLLGCKGARPLLLRPTASCMDEPRPPEPAYATARRHPPISPLLNASGFSGLRAQQHLRFLCPSYAGMGVASSCCSLGSSSLTRALYAGSWACGWRWLKHQERPQGVRHKVAAGGHSRGASACSPLTLWNGVREAQAPPTHPPLGCALNR